MSGVTKPVAISDAMAAFPANVNALLPELPIEKSAEQDHWEDFAAHWFFHGVEVESLSMAEGVDAGLAFRHLEAVLRTFSLKHEVKTACVAKLASLWIERVELKTGEVWERGGTASQVTRIFGGGDA